MDKILALFLFLLAAFVFMMDAGPVGPVIAGASVIVGIWLLVPSRRK